MKKNDFLFLLLGVSYACFKETKKELSKQLTPEFKYDVYLNMSHENERLNFDIYPEDDGKVVKDILDREVITLLCRKDKIPVWIDIYVSNTSEDFTTFSLLCSGNYSGDRNEFYYDERGTGSFGIKIQTE